MDRILGFVQHRKQANRKCCGFESIYYLNNKIATSQKYRDMIKKVQPQSYSQKTYKDFTDRYSSDFTKSRLEIIYE